MSKNIWTILAVLVAGAANAGGYRFEQADVLDLSAPEHLPPSKRAAALTTLIETDAHAILAKPERGVEDSSQLRYLDQADAKLRNFEKGQLAKEPAVHRDGGLLKLKPKAGAGVEFRDEQHGDDSETFVYAGRIGQAGYHRIEERFGQDSPGSFLVNPRSGKTAFVHNGSDVVELSRDQRRLLAFDPLNAPFLLAVATLDATGPRVVLQCRASGEGVAAATLKTWGDDGTLELVLTMAKPEGAALPLRIAPGPHGWQLAAPQSPLVGKAGYACSS